MRQFRSTLDHLMWQFEGSALLDYLIYVVIAAGIIVPLFCLIKFPVLKQKYLLYRYYYEGENPFEPLENKIN